MMEWHNELCTGEDSECLMGIGGPNTAILAPRGSAKSTVLGLFAAWMIGRHAAAKQMLRILYIAYMVDISRAKSATIKGILTSTKYREVFCCRVQDSTDYWQSRPAWAGPAHGMALVSDRVESGSVWQLAARLGDCPALRGAWPSLPAPLVQTLRDLGRGSPGALPELATDGTDDRAGVTGVLGERSYRPRVLAPAALAMRAPI